MAGKNAMDTGTMRRGAAREVTREARASKNITIRMAQADLDLARKQAEKKDFHIRPTSNRCCMRHWSGDSAAGQVSCPCRTRSSSPAPVVQCFARRGYAGLALPSGKRRRNRSCSSGVQPRRKSKEGHPDPSTGYWVRFVPLSPLPHSSCRPSIVYTIGGKIKMSPSL